MKKTQQEIADALQIIANEQSQIKRGHVRNVIQETAGDIPSLLGTIADVAQLLLVAHCHVIDGISKATTIAEIKAVANTSPLAADAVVLLADIAAGTVKMPYLLKGEPAVIADIKTRATAVATALGAK